MKFKVSMAMVVLASSAILAHAAELSTEIVSQDGVTVTVGDIDAFMQRIPEDRRIGFLDSSKRIDQMVIGILRDKQLAKQARELKLDQDAQTKAELAYAQDQVLAVKRMQTFVDSLKIPSMEQAAKEEYQAHKADYAVPESVVVQHVLISPNQGNISDASSNKMAKEFAAAAQMLNKPNDISPVVKTQFGYHVLKLISRTPAHQQEFASVKGKIVGALKDRYINEQRLAFLTQFDKGTPSVNPEILDILPTEAAAKGSQ